MDAEWDLISHEVPDESRAGLSPDRPPFHFSANVTIEIDFVSHVVDRETQSPHTKPDGRVSRWNPRGVRFDKKGWGGRVRVQIRIQISVEVVNLRRVSLICINYRVLQKLC